MQKLFSLIALSLLLMNSADIQKQTDRDREHLLGQVHAIHSQLTRYMDVEGLEKGSTKQMDIVNYDQNGNELARTIYDDYGFLVGEETHTRDAKGNLLESVLTDPKGVVIERRVYTYGADKMTQIISTDEKGNIRLKQVNSFGSNGRLDEELYFDRNKAIGKTAYRYDDKGNVIEVAFYMTNGSKAVAPFGPCLGAHRVTYSYNERSQPIKIVVYDSDGGVKQSQQYTYNSKGQEAEKISESAWALTKTNFTYEYDSKGNWIKQIAIENDRSTLAPEQPNETKTAISREITYY